MASVDLSFTEQTVARIGRKPEALIPILQELQEHYGYLPEEALRRVCEASEIRAASITGVSTFYDMFRHEPVGKHLVRVCRGTACHVAGVERVEDALRRQLRIPAGHDTDADRQFTVEQVACLGCCTLAPVVKIGDTTFGHSTAENIEAKIHEYLASHSTASAVKSTEQLQRRLCAASCSSPSPSNGSKRQRNGWPAWSCLRSAPNVKCVESEWRPTAKFFGQA